MGGGMVDKQLAEAAAGMHLKQFMPRSHRPRDQSVTPW